MCPPSPHKKLLPHNLITDCETIGSSTSHIGSVKAVHVVLLRAAVMVADCAALLLGGCNLGLKCGGIGIDPLKLGKVPVEDTNDLTQLEKKISYYKRTQKNMTRIICML